MDFATLVASFYILNQDTILTDICLLRGTKGAMKKSIFLVMSMPLQGNGNGLLFHMTQPTSRSTTKSHCTKQTNNARTLEQMKIQWHNS